MSEKKSAKQLARIAELERKLLECEAQLIHKPHYLSKTLEKYHQLNGSGVIVTFQKLGQDSEDGPVLIKNGLSTETILALQKDLRASWEDCVIFEPKKVRNEDLLNALT